MQKKKYIILGQSILGSGGAQIYYVNKKRYLETQGWEVNIFTFHTKGKVVYKEFEDFYLNILDTATISPKAEIFYSGEKCELVLANMPGKHNLYNAVAAIAAANSLGVPLGKAASLLGDVARLPARRFEHFEHNAGLFKIISDYAHHPEEIKALISAAKLVPSKRIVAVFQPHRYSRTKNFIEEFPIAFEGCDEVIIPPVYAASESPLCGGTNASLYAAFRKAKELDPATAPEPIYAAGCPYILELHYKRGRFGTTCWSGGYCRNIT